MPSLADLADSPLTLSRALAAFATAATTQNQQHIRPLHHYIAARLVIEGGFRPEEISPRPPLRSEHRNRNWRLIIDVESTAPTEGIILGGINTKIVDVVVIKPRLGPVLIISVKGTVGAFRNLTNRMEEAVGDSANIHMQYPGLVYGFIHVLRANPDGPDVKRNDVAVDADGRIVRSIVKFHDIMLGMTGRRFLHDDVARYEAGCLLMVDMEDSDVGRVFAGFPPEDSPLQLTDFFSTLYKTYDLRYPYVAERISEAKRVT